MAKEEIGPLPVGRHGLSRAQVADSQRERLLAAIATTAVKRGYNAVTIADITAAASISRRDFYAHFAGKEECFIAAFDAVVEHLRLLLAEAAEAAATWPETLRAAATALLAFFASEPELAQLCFIETRSAGGNVAARYREQLQSFAGLLADGRAERASERALPADTEDILLGSIAAMIARKVSAGEAERLLDLLPDVVEFAATPYLGPERAAQLASSGA